ncbi:hypothetical protein NE237_010747 [Protea cynaroides]|uniref:Uncharacterized protein n=1 Tax=Protea cynaroides TaxID=273540 RepID=A0A9Q0L0A5_9MAGN|nr:hypothetical protein NE237_010747 [Protea cynaroides]
MTGIRTFEHLYNIVNVNYGNDVLQALKGSEFEYILRIQSSKVDGANECLKCFGVVPRLYKPKKRLKIDLKHRVRAVALLVIGSFIALDTSGGYVSTFYHTLVQNIDEIRNFAWREAILVSLYLGLGMYKLRGRGITGYKFLLSFLLTFFSFLQLFTLQYIRQLLDLMDVSRPPLTFPLIMDWCRVMTLLSKNVHHDITWQPYQNLSEDILPVGVRQQMDKVVAIKSMLWINYCIYHQPYLAPR